MEMGRQVRTKAPRYALLGCVALYSVIPVLSMFSAALMPQNVIPEGLNFPLHPQWHNFVAAWSLANMTTLLKSSVLLVLGVVPIAVLISTLAAYAIVVLDIPLGKLFYFVLLLTLALPFEIVVIPLYFQDQSMGLLNSRWGLVLPLIGLNMPFAVFWMRSYFVNMPPELYEAGSVEGASALQMFRRIHLPLAQPAIASLGLLMFLSTWNQFLLPLVLMSNPNEWTLAGALQTFQNKYGTNEVLLCAGAVELMAPTILVYLVLQRHFVKALIQGAVKG
jgi:raffinose/stachyose/melibiose transport system permease protein